MYSSLTLSLILGGSVDGGAYLRFLLSIFA